MPASATDPVSSTGAHPNGQRAGRLTVSGLRLHFCGDAMRIRIALETYVNNPRVSFRSISVGATMNWEDYEVLIPDVPQREDTYVTGVIFRQTSGDFPQTISPTHRIQIRIVETGGDLPEPFIIEHELPIRSAE